MAKFKLGKRAGGALAIVVGGVAFIAAKTLAGGASTAVRSAMTPQAEVERRIDGLATSDPMLAAMAQAFPQDWAQFRAEMAADIKSSMSDGSVRQSAHARSRDFMARKLPALAAAPDRVIISVAIKDFRVAETLQREDLQACADFGMRGLNPQMSLSTETQRLVSEAGAARINAARVGSDRPQARTSATDSDWEALLMKMHQNGTSDAVFSAMEGASQDPALVCDGTVQLYRALTELPEKQGAKLFVQILTEAIKTAS